MSKVICWFRRDLRLADNPAFYEASQLGEVLAIYILDELHATQYAIGDASRLYLSHALSSLNQDLCQKLCFFVGDPIEILIDLCMRHEISAVFWNRCYEPWQIKRDSIIKDKLKAQGIRVSSSNASLLWEPWEVLKKDGSPYAVFTPFYRTGCNQAKPPRRPLSIPDTKLVALPLGMHQHQVSVEQFKQILLSSTIMVKMPRSISEKSAHQQLLCFLSHKLMGYQVFRDYPAREQVSDVSAALHYGLLSPHQVYYAVRDEHCDGIDSDAFCRELAWREFCYYLLYFYPELPEQNLQKRFDAFPWREEADVLFAWQSGQTGVPLVDAGMRALRLTGTLHNRLRMIVASFLVKNLLQHWRYGAQCFWNQLFDADLANNSVNWQWVAGCGVDPSPFFRVFNPVLQGKKYDAEGEYVRHYVPELSELDNSYIFEPWKAPSSLLEKAGIRLGSTYPLPIVDLVESRKRALAAFSTLKN